MISPHAGDAVERAHHEHVVFGVCWVLLDRLHASSLGFIFYHLAPYTVSPTDLVARCSTWEGEGHKTKTHACVTRTVIGHPLHEKSSNEVPRQLFKVRAKAQT
jgi:hypothetical protein